MTSPEHYTAKFPKAARNIIEAALRDVSTIEIDPEMAVDARERIENCLEWIAKRGNEGASGVVTYNYLAGEFQDFADGFLEEPEEEYDYEEDDEGGEDDEDDKEISFHDLLKCKSEETRIIISEHFRSMAQSIASLTGQKSGGNFEPRALKEK